MQWLWISLVASVVLTVLLNVAIRLWPSAADRSARRLDDWAAGAGRRQVSETSGVRVIVPWKAMLVLSLVGTVLLNLVLWLV